MSAYALGSHQPGYSGPFRGGAQFHTEDPIYLPMQSQIPAELKPVLREHSFNKFAYLGIKSVDIYRAPEPNTLIHRDLKMLRDA